MYNRFTNGGTIYVCTNNTVQSKWGEILTHELVHAFDDCLTPGRLVATDDCLTEACSETRAYSIDGNCDVAGAGGRKNNTRTREKCIQDGVELSLGDRAKDKECKCAVARAMRVCVVPVGGVIPPWPGVPGEPPVEWDRHFIES